MGSEILLRFVVWKRFISLRIYLKMVNVSIIRLGFRLLFTCSSCEIQRSGATADAAKFIVDQPII